MSEIRAASTGKTGKTTVLPGFLAGKTWSYLDFQKKAEVLFRKGNLPFPYYLCVPMKELITVIRGYQKNVVHYPYTLALSVA